MIRGFLAFVCVGCGLVGCAEKQMDMAEMMEQPAPAPEMEMLKPLLGTWTGTAELIEPTPAEMAANMPEGSDPPPSTFQGGGTWEMVLDDMFIKMEGWHEMGDGRMMHMVEYITWDDQAGKFHSWWFGSNGETGEGWQTASEGGRKFTVKASGKDAAGKRKSGSGTWTMVDDNTVDWTWEETGPMGKIKMKGTSTKTTG